MEGLMRLRCGILIWILFLHPILVKMDVEMCEVSQGRCCKGANEKLIVWLVFRWVMSGLLTRLKNFYSSLLLLWLWLFLVLLKRKREKAKISHYCGC